MRAAHLYDTITGLMNKVSGVMILCIFLVVFGDIIARNIFKISIISASEISIFLLVYASFISAAFAIPKGLHFVLFDWKRKMAVRMHSYLTGFVDFLIIVFSVFVGFYGFKLGMSQMGQMIAALGIPYGYMYMALPTFSILVILTLSLRYLAYGWSSEPKAECDEVQLS